VELVEEHADRVIVNVGMRVAEIRRQLGLTQAQAAERLKMPLKNLQRVEAGMNLTIRTLVRIADGLGVPPRSLLEEPWPVARRRGRPRSV
jgi:transcriptional regulator with XRE-family HTH domain